MTRTKKCEERIAGHWESRRSDLIGMIEGERYDELGEYFLEATHVEAHPAISPKGLHLQHAPFYKLGISWGGPSEEIRFYQDGTAEFVLCDWGDIASLVFAKDGEEAGDHAIAYFLKEYFFEDLEPEL
tara:strand:+ start:1960 stop:2343 length:384 start_codon:yes stop_codon:yes gene_type:complete